MWQDGTQLVFTADLPLIDNVKYLRYHLWNLPIIAPNASGYSLQLQVPTDLAYDMLSGNMFIPQDCLEHGTCICKPGAVFTKE